MPRIFLKYWYPAMCKTYMNCFPKRVLDQPQWMDKRSVSTEPSPRRKRRVFKTEIEPTKKQALMGYLKMLNTKEESEITRRFLTIKRCAPEYCFPVEETVANKIVDVIKTELLADDASIIEGNPGIGLITKALVNAGIKKIKIFDPLYNSLQPLQNLILENPDKFELIPCNIFEIYKVLFQDSMDEGNRIETLFSGVKVQNWNGPPAAKVIGIINSTKYFKHLIRTMVFHNKLMNYGRMEHYVLVNYQIYHGIVTNQSWSMTRMFSHILLNILMDITLLGEFPRDAFLPWDTTCAVRKKQSARGQTMYLIKVDPRRDIFERVNRKDIISLVHFVKAIANKRTNRVIPVIEDWIPGCGVHLIKKGISITTRVQDLSSLEILQLFEEFVSLPEYNEVKFLHNVDSGEEVAESIDEDEGYKDL